MLFMNEICLPGTQSEGHSRIAYGITQREGDENRLQNALSKKIVSYGIVVSFNVHRR